MNLPQGLTGRPIAHRGLWRVGLAPENSLAAFEAACAAGYGIELDVRLTADGEAVVFHDDDLDRMTAQSGLVEERTLEALMALNFLGGDHQCIPSLAQTLQVIAGRSLVLIELKTPTGQEGLLEAKVAEQIAAYAGPAAVLSFNAEALAWMARHHPSIPRGLNANQAEALPDATLAQADFLSLNLCLGGHPDVKSWRAVGGAAVAWTVRSEAQRAALAHQVDNIIFEGLAP